MKVIIFKHNGDILLVVSKNDEIEEGKIAPTIEHVLRKSLAENYQRDWQHIDYEEGGVHRHTLGHQYEWFGDNGNLIVKGEEYDVNDIAEAVLPRRAAVSSL